MNTQLIYPRVWNLIPPQFMPYMNDAIKAIGDLYNSPIPQPFNYDFEDHPILKYSYFYLHFVCISNAVNVCLAKTLCSPRWFKLMRKVNVCCVGGGSGSDLVGICQFLDMFYIDVNIQINAVILDYYNWSDETRELLAHIRGSYEYNIVNFDYIFYNFYSPITYEIMYEIQHADLVTIVKFLSAVGNDEKNLEQLQTLLSYVSESSLVFFMDNSGGGYAKMMETAAKAAGLMLICKVEHKRIFVPDDELQLMEYARFSKPPSKSTSVSASLWIQQS